MSVLAFSVARFTPSDVAVFMEIAAPRLRAGLWAATHRQSGSWGDRISIHLPGRADPLFRFERDRQGTYALYYHDRSGSHRIGFAATAAECLRVWRMAPRAARIGRDQAAAL
jgi:hypothetical protein